MYTTPNIESGNFNWNDGSSNFTTVGATSTSGMENTNLMINATGNADYPYEAAERCRTYGPLWFLPSQAELSVIYGNKDAIGETSNSYFVSSSEHDNDRMKTVRFFNGATGDHQNKNIARAVRCVRGDNE